MFARLYDILPHAAVPPDSNARTAGRTCGPAQHAGRGCGPIRTCGEGCPRCSRTMAHAGRTEAARAAGMRDPHMRAACPRWPHRTACGRRMRCGRAAHCVRSLKTAWAYNGKILCLYCSAKLLVSLCKWLTKTLSANYFFLYGSCLLDLLLFFHCALRAPMVRFLKWILKLG